jgi:hypothetical protein
MSALPLKADVDHEDCNVRFVPVTDISSSFLLVLLGDSYVG